MSIFDVCSQSGSNCHTKLSATALILCFVRSGRNFVRTYVKVGPRDYATDRWWTTLVIQPLVTVNIRDSSASVNGREGCTASRGAQQPSQGLGLHGVCARVCVEVNECIPSENELLKCR